MNPKLWMTALIVALVGGAPALAGGARGARGVLAGEPEGDLPPPPPFQPLARGAKGDAARIAQHLLADAARRAGAKPITVDGDFGGRTAAAVEGFQRAAGLEPTGVIDAETWRRLRQYAAGPLGSIDPLALPTTSDRYGTEKPGSDVAIHTLPATPSGTQPLLFESKLAVDADGAGDAWRSDPWGQPETSLRYPNGTSVNPTVIPYFVLPIGFEAAHPGVKLGDIAAVIHKGRVAYAIYADRGPKRKIGEGSIKLAQELDINADPRNGGVGGGVIYMVFPGSGTGRPMTPEQIRERGAQLLAEAGGAPNAGQ